MNTAFLARPSMRFMFFSGSLKRVGTLAHRTASWALSSALSHSETTGFMPLSPCFFISSFRMFIIACEASRAVTVFPALARGMAREPHPAPTSRKLLQFCALGRITAMAACGKPEYSSPLLYQSALSLFQKPFCIESFLLTVNEHLINSLTRHCYHSEAISPLSK